MDTLFTDDVITTVLNNTNKKIMGLIEQLPEEVRSNNKYTYLREVTKEEFLAFFGILYARDLLGQKFLELRRLFSVDVAHPIFSAGMRLNRLVFIKVMISFDDANTQQERWRANNLLHLEKYLRSSTKVALKTCLQMIILPQAKHYIQQEVVYHSRHTAYINQLNMVRMLEVWAVLGILTFITLCHIPESQ